MVLPVISRTQALAFRQHVSNLHRRLRQGSFVEAAFAGLQDSSPRSAVLSLHARVRDVSPSAWENQQLVQIWGPRGAIYVVPKKDVAVFTIGRLPREQSDRTQVEASVERVANVMRFGIVENARSPSALSRQYLHDLRIASIKGGLRIRWDGSRISWWTVPPDTEDAEFARLELARRFLQSLGPSTPAGFAWWSGGTLSDAKQTFRSLERELSEVKLQGAPSWALTSTMSQLKRGTFAPTVRLLPPGDPYLGAADRELLVPEARFRSELWPKSVWPGSVHVRGELIGTWRRRKGRVVVRQWRRMSAHDMEAVAREVKTMPIDSVGKDVRWEPSVKSS